MNQPGAQPDRYVAVFHQVDLPGRSPGRTWIAELRDDSGWLTYPVSVAWITDYTPTLGFSLDFILVPDQFRRQGLATRLIRECEAHWPNLFLTDAISPAGEGLIDSLEVPS